MKFLLIILSLFSASLSFAQEPNKPFEKILGWKGKVSVTSISDSVKNNTCVIAENDNHLAALLFDKEMRFVKDFAMQITEEKIIGGFIGESKIQIYSNPGFNDLVHNITIDIQTGEVSDTTFSMELKGERFLGYLNAGNSFLYITASKKTPVFHVYKFKGNNLEKISFDLRNGNLDKNFPEGSLWAALSSASGLSRSADIAIVSPDNETDVVVASSHNKLYLQGNKLALVLDAASDNVLILDFDLTSKLAGARRIKRPFKKVELEEFNKPEFNSFLIENQLYSVQAASDSLNLVIQDFQSGKILNSFRTLEKDTIGFKNTPIIQDGGNSIYTANSERNLEKTKQLLRKMLNGEAVITGITNQKGQHEITVGAYKKITQSGGFAPGGMGMAGGAIGSGLTLTVTPGFGSSWTKVVRFKSLIDPSSSSHITGGMAESLSEQIERYTESMTISASASSILVHSNYYQFAYYDRDAKTLVVMKFE